MNPAKHQWVVSVKGHGSGRYYEVSVVREDDKHGQKSYGWFGPTKLLIGHNGGPCDWPVIPYVWNAYLALANEVCAKLNSGELEPPLP